MHLYTGNKHSGVEVTPKARDGIRPGRNRVAALKEEFEHLMLEVIYRCSATQELNFTF